jgi:hypothetical protein
VLLRKKKWSPVLIRKESETVETLSEQSKHACCLEDN